MALPNRRFHALLYLIVLFPLWWIQRTHASDLPTLNPVRSTDPGTHLNSEGGDGDDDDSQGDDDDSDDGDDDDGDDCNHDDGDDDDSGVDGDDDGDDGDDDDEGDDDDGGCDITDCNGNGIDDSIDIEDRTSFDANHDGIPDECQSGVRPFCEGDGSDNGGADCPCLNNSPNGTTAGCLNRDGVGATLTATGNPSVSNDTLVLHVDGVPLGVPGFFFQGASDAGFNPFGNGLRCIGGPFIRLSKIHGQLGGNDYPPPGGTPISEQFNIPAGATTYYQVLYRDGGGPCGTSINASNGLQVVWGL